MQIENSRAYHYVNNRQLDGTQTGETLEKRLQEKDDCVQQLGIMGQQMEEERGKLKQLMTCMEISRRIAGGDKVPPADHRYLREHDPALYFKSISMRFPKSNPYQYKQLSKDDEPAVDITAAEIPTVAITAADLPKVDIKI
ncbi:MAG TPA: hypothetical protein PKA19_13030 [Bacillota bacterium]|nr:hypothetical protein [Bacillota bacterium]